MKRTARLMLPIRVVVIAMLGLFVVSLITILYTQRRASDSMVDSAMQSAIQNVADGVVPRSEDFLRDAQASASLAASLVSSGVIETNAQREAYFGEVLQESPDVSGIFYGTVTGEFLFVNRSDEAAPDGYRTKTIQLDGPTRTVELVFRDADFRVQASRLDNEDDYDPRVRPWFTAASDSGGPIITDPYVFFTSQRPGVTTAVPVYGAPGDLVGVVGVDIDLSRLSEFLGELSLGDRGVAFLVSRNGEVIALEDQSQLRQPDGEGFRLSTIEEVDDPVLTAAVQQIDVGAVSTPTFFNLSLDVKDAPSHGFAAPIGPSDWILGVALAESDFVGDVQRTQGENTMLAIVISGVCLVAAWLLIRNVTSPLSVLRRRAAGIEAGRLEPAGDVVTNITELQETSEAFDHMILGLRTQQQRNEELMNSLERRVEDRTADLRQENMIRRRAERRAAEASEAKSRFLASMSHEIRTPLNAIMGLSELMKVEAHGPMNPEYREYAADINAAANHLLGLVSETLDLAQVEARKLKLSESTFDLNADVTEVVRLLGQLALEQGVAVDVDLPPGQIHIEADRRRIKQILFNLISNAIKYTPEGGSVQVTVDRTRNGRLKLAVSDTGRGMSRSELSVALSPFGRVGNAETTGQPGTGLGLPIAAALAEAHGGNLELTSTVGDGTTARFYLPANRLVEVGDEVPSGTGH